jgi:hypothetical protein
MKQLVGDDLSTFRPPMSTLGAPPSSSESGERIETRASITQPRLNSLEGPTFVAGTTGRSETHQSIRQLNNSKSPTQLESRIVTSAALPQASASSRAAHMARTIPEAWDDLEVSGPPMLDNSEAERRNFSEKTRRQVMPSLFRHPSLVMLAIMKRRTVRSNGHDWFDPISMAGEGPVSLTSVRLFLILKTSRSLTIHSLSMWILIFRILMNFEATFSQS